ncbi:MAG TPA: hypothetical protein VH518_19035 [Tepidisphaeraceae bacterium]|jgi:hypothetical protein
MAIRMSAVFAVVIILAGDLNAGESPTSQPALKLRIQDVMTPQESVAAGIDKLTPAQRAAMEAWLNRYTAAVIRIAATSQEPQRVAAEAQSHKAQGYAGLGGGHWIKTNGEGKIIVLEDGSTWEVEAVDQIDSLLWLPVTDISVVLARDPIGEYRYTLINKEDGEKVLAKYVGSE